MENNDIFILIGAVVVGFIWGWITRERVAVSRVKEIMDELDENDTENVTVNPIKIIIEQHNSHYYVYAIEDRTFMAQGGTKQELEDNLAKRYPGKLFAATPENLKEIGFTK